MSRSVCSRGRRAAQSIGTLIAGALLALHMTAAGAAAPHAISVSFQPTGTSCTEALAKGPSNIPTIAADRTTSIVVCAHVEDVATGTDQSQIPVEFRVTVGTLGASGTSKYSGIVFSTAAGVSQISYRGDGVSFGTDTVLATYEGGRAIALASIEVTPPAGRAPARIVVLQPLERAIAATDLRPERTYASPATAVSLAVQVQDATGLGVNGQALLVTADRVRLAANPAFALPPATACAAATERSILVTTNGTDATAVGGQPRPGTVDLVVCAFPGDGPGEASVRIESITAPHLLQTTLVIPVAGRPATITARVEAQRLVARVTDATGVPAADGTPVRFAIAPAAGVVSASCALTRGGEAGVAVGLDRAEATVLVSAEYTTTGAAASCAGGGSERVQVSVPVSAQMLTAAAGG